jgi:hypothetical protein
MLYVHPWEVAARLRRDPDVPLRLNITRHAGLRHMRPRLDRLLASERDRLVPMGEAVAWLGELPVWTGRLSGAALAGARDV